MNFSHKKLSYILKILLNELYLVFVNACISFAVLAECNMKQMRIGTSHASIYGHKNITILPQTQTV